MKVQRGKSKWTSAFGFAIEHTLSAEGVYGDDEYDPGGETKFGISAKAYPDLDIEGLALADARKIYYDDYWSFLGLDRLDSWYVAAELFDTGVNMGPATAVKIAQEAANHLAVSGFPPERRKLKVDGKLGPKTVRVLNALSLAWHRDLLEEMNLGQLEKYGDLIKKNPRLARFEKGWAKRCWVSDEVTDLLMPPDLAVEAFEKETSYAEEMIETMKEVLDATAPTVKAVKEFLDETKAELPYSTNPRTTKKNRGKRSN